MWSPEGSAYEDTHEDTLEDQAYVWSQSAFRTTIDGGAKNPDGGGV